jgi:hypothetical protein
MGAKQGSSYWVTCPLCFGEKKFGPPNGERINNQVLGAFQRVIQSLQDASIKHSNVICMSASELCIELATEGLLDIDIDIELGACQPDDGIEVTVTAYIGERFTSDHSFTIISSGPEGLSRKDIRSIVAAIFNHGRGIGPVDRKNNRKGKRSKSR